MRRWWPCTTPRRTRPEVSSWVTRMWRYMTELVTGRTPPAPPPTYAQPTATEARAQAHRAQADQPAEPNYPKPPAGGAAA